MSHPVKASGIARRFGRAWALRALDLDVAPGEIVALLGPNGAGKTTTLRILTGLLAPTEGEVRIAGHDLFRDGIAAKRLIGYVPDRPHLYERLTAWEYLRFVAALWRLPKGSWEETARTALARFRLEEEANELLETFSYGMRQKVVFTAGLIHAPKAWILDEPMSGLDPRSAREMGAMLKEEAARGAGILLSTHTLDLAVRLADRLVILDEGAKVAEGTLDELREAADEIHAKAEGAASGTGTSLEEVFLRLTAASAAGDGGAP